MYCNVLISSQFPSLRTLFSITLSTIFSPSHYRFKQTSPINFCKSMCLSWTMLTVHQPKQRRCAHRYIYLYTFATDICFVSSSRRNQVVRSIRREGLTSPSGNWAVPLLPECESAIGHLISIDLSLSIFRSIDPYLSSRSPYHSAYPSTYLSVSLFSVLTFPHM